MELKIFGNELEINCKYDEKSENKINELIEINSITKLIFKNDILIPIDNLPNGICQIIIYCNMPFDLANLPNSVEQIYLINWTNSLNNLCGNVKFLSVGDNYNNLVTNLPCSLEEIIFGKLFNQTVDYLPDSIKSIKFGNEFNHPIDNLPYQMKIIIFGEKFNHSIDNLPNSIIYISFDWISVFNQPIYKLPDKLEELYLGNNFNNIICKLPDRLEKILLGCLFDKPIILPKKLKKIKLSSKYKFFNIIQNTLDKYVIKELY